MFKTTTFLLGMWVLSALLPATSAFAQYFIIKKPFLPAPDLSIFDTGVDTVIANQIDYHFYLTNTGGSLATLNKYCVKTYLSSNNTWDATDVVVDTVYLNSDPYAINYVAVPTFTAPVSLDDYPYLITKITLLPGQTDPNDPNTNNDTNSVYVPASFSNLIVASVDIQAHEDDSITFDYSVVAQRSIHLHYFEYELFLSVDDTLDSSDVSAGSAPMVNRDAVVGGPFSFDGFGSNTIKIDAANYSYLIFIAKSIGVPYYESNYDDNQMVVPIQSIILHRPSGPHLNKYNLARDADNLTVSNTSTQQNNNYVLYNLNGDKMEEGTFTDMKDINTSSYRNGLYFLKMSNEESTETMKVVVQH